MNDADDLRDLARYFRDPWSKDVMKPGVSGEACANLAYALDILGFGARDAQTTAGMYTDGLATLVRAFQAANAHTTVDGLCGPGTARLLARVLEEKYTTGVFSRGLTDPEHRREGQLFISYARADAKRIQPLIQLIKSWGYTVWYDTALEGVAGHGGVEWEKALQREIEHSYMLIVLLSAAAIESEWVISEATYADHLDLVVLPIPIDPIPPGHGLETILARRQLISSTPVALAGMDSETAARLAASIRNAHTARKPKPHPPLPPPI